MKNILIIGGAGGIGQALLQVLLDKNNNTDTSIANSHQTQTYRLFATYHRQLPHTHRQHTKPNAVTWLQLDVSDEDSIIEMVALLKKQVTHLDWVINAVGLLHSDEHMPEKSIRQMNPDFFMQNMRLNALPSLLIAKHIKTLLKSATRSPKHPAIFASLSARVGSISDNRLGGWYSYRMSKSALNMGMKTLAIEWAYALKMSVWW